MDLLSSIVKLERPKGNALSAKKKKKIIFLKLLHKSSTLAAYEQMILLNGKCWFIIAMEGN